MAVLPVATDKAVAVLNLTNDLLNASLKQRQAVTLTNIAFGEQSESMQEFASRMQSVTNHGDEELLPPLMAKMRQTFKMTTEEVQAITPYRPMRVLCGTCFCASFSPSNMHRWMYAFVSARTADEKSSPRLEEYAPFSR